MNRLPCFDQTTQRLEAAVFASLGFAGVLMVSLALVETSRFVANHDQIAAALSKPQELLAATPAGGGTTVVIAQ